MTGDNRVVQGLWWGRLTELERLCIRSWCANGHEFHLYTYGALGELENLPRADGLRIMDAEEVLPSKAVFLHKTGLLSFFADQFRFELLRQRGGWWVDMDTVCVRPLDFAAEVVLFNTDSPAAIWNCVMKFPRGHFLAAALADSYKNVNRVSPWDDWKTIYRKSKRRLIFWRDWRRHVRYWHAGGLIGLASAVRHYKMEQCAMPVSFMEFPGDPQGRALVESAGYDFDGILSAAPDLRFFHLSNTVWKEQSVDKDGSYPADSLYEVLKRRYPE